MRFRNFGLLSFGEEAEEDETETNDYVQKNVPKSKSVHDIVDDPKLSKQAIDIRKTKKDDDDNDDDAEADTAQPENDDELVKEKADRIRDKLKKLSNSNTDGKRKAPPETNDASDSDSDDYSNALEKERKIKRQKKA